MQDFTLAVVTLQESVIEVWLLDVVYPAGKVPETEKLKESLLGSSAMIVMVANVWTVTLTSAGPTNIFGGKFSEKQLWIPGFTRHPRAIQKSILTSVRTGEDNLS